MTLRPSLPGRGRELGGWLAVAWLGVVALLLLQHLVDLDVFWQIRLGTLMLEQRQLIGREPFSYTLGGQPLEAPGWLGFVWLGGLYRLGSWNALRVWHAVAFGGALAAAAWAARPDVRRPLPLVAAMLMGFIAALPQSELRTQALALECFAVLVLICSGPHPAGPEATAGRSWRSVVLGLPLLVLWQNLHPSVMTAALWLGPQVAAGWLAWLRARRRPPSPSPLSPSVAPAAAPWPLTVLLALVVLAQLLTPMGTGVLELQRRNLAISRDLLQVREWLPAWDPDVRGIVWAFWALSGLSMVLLVRLRGRARPADLGVLLVFTALTLRWSRFALFYGAAMVPVWARWFDAASAATPRPARADAGAAPEAPGAGRHLRMAALAALAVLVPVLFARGPTFSSVIPLAAVARLDGLLPAGRIYTYYGWAGPLLLAGHPRWQVSIDSRLYLYEATTWRRYQAESTGQVPLEELLARHRPAAFFLRPGAQDGLLAQLRRAPGWSEVFTGKNAVVFLPRR
jgi:hypothetical protein